MNDKRIEEMLQKSWQPQTPDGMRERVLRSARQELNKPMKHSISRWKLALACLGIAVAILTNVADNVRQSRVSNMICGGIPSKAITSPVNVKSLFEMRREMDRLWAQAPESNIRSSSKGDGSL